MIDLHIHSSASDGDLSPSELIYHGLANSLSIMALTDHDTDAGLAEANEAALKVGILFVPGIELNIEWQTGEFHLLGLGLQKISLNLRHSIAFLQEGRNKRNYEILKKMQSFGINISLDTLKADFNTQSLGRPHFADFLVQKKLVKNRQQAFDKYLGKGRPFFVERLGLNLDEAIIAIKESGGLPVLAHPLSLYVSWGKLENVLHQIYERGVEGLEAWHPAARFSECERLEKLGRNIGFFITAGSDFHGEKIRPDRKIGRTSGSAPIDERFWTEELYPRLPQKQRLTQTSPVFKAQSFI